MPVATLTLRIPKGAPLTAGEHDDNLGILRDAINGLEQRLAVSIDEDGNIRVGLISGDILTDLSIVTGKLANLVVTASKLATDAVETDKIKDLAVTLAKLQAALLGAMMPKAMPIGNDLVFIGDSADGNNSKSATITSILSKAMPRFTSTETAIATGAIINTAHGLGATPGRVRLVLVCQTTDVGYAAGDEIDAGQDGCSSAGDTPIFVVGANSTNVFCLCSSTTLRGLNKTTGALDTLTAANWKAKIVAEP